MNHRFYKLVGLSILCGLLLAACLPTTEYLNNQSQDDSTYPTPTVNSIFKNKKMAGDTGIVGVSQEKAIPTVASYFQQRNTPTPRPLTTSTPPSLFATKEPRAIDFIESVIFDDELSSNWNLLEDTGTRYDVTNLTPVFAGNRSISLLPDTGYGALFFTINENTSEVFSRNNVLGITFQLNGGDEYIPLDGLSVSIVGSDTLPYWTANDDSVKVNDGLPTFSETRLYFLGFNESIPPNTWVQVTVWLDERIFDPDYKYVTGFYIKNDEFFYQEVFIDEVALLLLESAEVEENKLETAVTLTPTNLASTSTLTATMSAITDTNVITATPTPTPTPTPTVILTQPPPQPTPPPPPEVPSKPIEALTMDLWVLADLGFCTNGTWQQKVFIEGHGGDNTYSYYWNEAPLDKLPDPGLLFSVEGSGDSEVIGTGKVISGDGQVLERQLTVPPSGC